MDLITESGAKRVVCFDKRRYKLFEEVNENAVHGVCIKRPRFDTDTDIVVTDFSKTSKINVQNIPPPSYETTLIQEAFAQKGLFERFHIKGILTNMSDCTNHKNEETGTTLKFRTAIFHDASGQSEITIFGDAAQSLEENIVYFLRHVYLGKFKTKRVLKTSDVSVLQKTNEEPAFDIKQRSIDTSVEKINCKFISIDLKSLVTKTLCKECRFTVEVEDGIVICGKCQIMTTVDQCIVDNRVMGAILDINLDRKISVSLAQDVLVACLNIPLRDDRSFRIKLFKNKFQATLDTAENNITKLDIVNEQEDTNK